MQRTKIVWPWEPLYTLNPVVGCARTPSCPYCYAKRMNDRFKWIPKWSKPKFFPERLNSKMPKKPSAIFIGSISDICHWFPGWILKTIDLCDNNPQHTFIFLTKEATIYLGYTFPQNCWLGLTINKITDVVDRDYSLLVDKLNKKFLSIEPILSDFPKCKFGPMDKVIVGADSSLGAIPPKPEWIQSIKDNVPREKIFWKSNIKKHMPEFVSNEYENSQTME